MQNTSIESTRRRPKGVTIIAILLGIEGILAIIVGILILATSFFVSHRIVVNGHAVVATAVNVVGGFLGGAPLIIGVLSLIFTWGLWMLKRWAFWTTIVVAALNIVIALPELFQTHPNIFSFIVRIIIPVIILLYFLLYPQVRHAFRM